MRHALHNDLSLSLLCLLAAILLPDVGSTVHGSALKEAGIRMSPLATRTRHS